jgi:ATP-dependent Clp protease ATP-binding subunit ClpX
MIASPLLMQAKMQESRRSALKPRKKARKPGSRKTAGGTAAGRTTDRPAPAEPGPPAAPQVPSTAVAAGRPPARPPKPRLGLTPRAIYEFLDQHLIGQERAKRAIAIAAYNHHKRCALPAADKHLLRKSNVLLIGPTGSGKTHLVRTLAQCLDVPLSIADATEYTEAGYYGKDVELLVAELLFRANQNVAKAQSGVIFIDEIDKLARRAQSYKTGGGTRDIGGEGVQQGLLKLLEGRELLVPTSLTPQQGRPELVQLDTTDILFIAAGTFSDLYDYTGSGARAIGFGGDPAERSGRSGRTGPAAPRGAAPRVRTEDLIAYGMLAELLGRLPVRVQLDALTEDELCAVLTLPQGALVREYDYLLHLDGVQLDWSEPALRELARAAIGQRCGARGLRSLMETVCEDLMFEAPERRGQTVHLTADYVRARLERAAGHRD